MGITMVIGLQVLLASEKPDAAPVVSAPASIVGDDVAIGADDAVTTVTLSKTHVCEASAAARLDARTIVVADDETPDRLSRFVILADGNLKEDGVVTVGPGNRPHDVESLIATDTTLSLVGSHGLSKRGSSRKRARILTLQKPTLSFLSAVDDETWMAPARGKPPLCGALFVEGARAATARLCPKLELEAEGAFLDAEGRMWLGLRRPLLEGRALFLRLRSGAPGFDRVAFVDLSGLGVRDVTPMGERLLVVGGPSEGGDDDGALFVVDPRAVMAGGRVSAQRLKQPAPPHTEAAVIVDEKLFLLTDGKRKDGVCTKPSTVTRIPLGALGVPVSSSVVTPSK